MALPVTIPNQFANATSSIPLSQLDTNFNTLSNAVNGINSGAETLANLVATTANVTTGNITTVNATTVDTTNIEVTNIKAKDGTAAIVIADSTGVVTLSNAIVTTAGTSAAPSITTTGDTNTGIFFPAADTIAFAEGGAEAMRINSSGNVGIGTTSPSTLLQIYNSTAATLAVEGDSGAAVRVSRYSSDSTSGTVQHRKARGTFASPTAVNSGDAVGLLNFSAFGGTNYRSVGSVQGSVDTYTSDTNISGFLTFQTNGGSTTATERMRLTSDGYLRMASGTGGIQFNGDTAAANALDDYEEGTFTLVVAPATGSLTSYNQQGFYTKVGRYRDWETDRKSTRLNSSHSAKSRMPSSA